MVFRMNSTYSEIEKSLDTNFIGFDLLVVDKPEGIHENVDIIILQTSFITITIHDLSLGTFLKLDINSQY